MFFFLEWFFFFGNFILTNLHNCNISGVEILLVASSRNIGFIYTFCSSLDTHHGYFDVKYILQFICIVLRYFMLDQKEKEI